MGGQLYSDKGGSISHRPGQPLPGHRARAASATPSRRPSWAPDDNLPLESKKESVRQVLLRQKTKVDELKERQRELEANIARLSTMMADIEAEDAMVQADNEAAAQSRAASGDTAASHASTFDGAIGAGSPTSPSRPSKHIRPSMDDGSGALAMAADLGGWADARRDSHGEGAVAGLHSFVSQHCGRLEAISARACSGPTRRRRPPAARTATRSRPSLRSSAPPSAARSARPSARPQPRRRRERVLNQLKAASADARAAVDAAKGEAPPPLDAEAAAHYEAVVRAH